MSNDLDRIVQVTISRQTAVPSMASFSTAMVLAEFLKASTTPAFGTSERVRMYGSLTEVEAAGFDDTTFVGKAAIAWFSQNPCPSTFYVGRKKTGADGTETYTDALSACNVENPAWYGLIIDSRTQADQEAVAAWVESNEKLFVLASADADVVDTTSGDAVKTLNTNAYDRSAGIYHPDVGGADECVPEAAWISKLFAKDPGAATWSFKTLAGVPVYTLTTAQINVITAKKGNFYIAIAGINATQYGTVGSGEYLDVIHGIDWLKARIQQRVFTPIAQNDKIPFTDAGVSIVMAELKAALDEAVARGVLASYTATAPLVANVAPADKSARLLPDLKFTGILAGAIHKTAISGIVTL